MKEQFQSCKERYFVRYIFDSIENFYHLSEAEYAGRCFAKRKFFYSKDYLGEKSKASNKPNGANEIKRILYNLREFVGALYHKRSPSLVQIIEVGLPKDCSVHANFINGTVVIMHEKFVDKFYFKDIKFYSQLYKILIPALEYNVYPTEDFLVMRMPRFAANKIAFDNRYLLHEINECMYAIRVCVNSFNTDKTCYSIAHQITRMGKNHYVPGDVIVEYAKCATAIFAPLDGSGDVCHGDLTPLNILKSLTGKMILIDFDKFLIADPSYDIVHLYLSAKIFSKNPNLEDIYTSMDDITDQIIRYMSDAGIANDAQSYARIRRNCLAVIFYKMTERDFSFRHFGRSLKTYKNKFFEALNYII